MSLQCHCPSVPGYILYTGEAHRASWNPSMTLAVVLAHGSGQDSSEWHCGLVLVDILHDMHLYIIYIYRYIGSCTDVSYHKFLRRIALMYPTTNFWGELPWCILPQTFEENCTDVSYHKLDVSYHKLLRTIALMYSTTDFWGELHWCILPQTFEEISTVVLSIYIYVSLGIQTWAEMWLWCVLVSID